MNSTLELNSISEIPQSTRTIEGVGGAALSGVLAGDTGELANERKLEGFVSPQVEDWLQMAWDAYDFNPDDPASVGLKDKADGIHREALKEMHEELSILGDPSERLQDFITIFGVANFGRYDPSRLAAQYIMWSSGNMATFDTLHIVGRYGDENGAYANVTGPFSDPDRVNGLVFEAGPDKSELEGIVSRTVEKGAKISTVVLSAHGNVEPDDSEAGVTIPDLGLLPETDLSGLAAGLKDLASNTPLVILDACLAGSETKAGSNLSREISKTLRDSFVIAPDMVILETLRDEHGVIHFSNQLPDGKALLYDKKTGTENAVRLKGTAVRPGARAFMNGQPANTSSPKDGFNPLRLRGRTIDL